MRSHIIKLLTENIWLRRFLVFVVAPSMLYFAFFSFYTWPWIANFSTHYFSDQVDGLQNIWNIWWSNKSITELGQSPWHTVWQHFPHGITVVPHTFNLINGLLAIPFLYFFDLNIVFNSLIIFSFVASGLTMLWLCYYFTKNYWASFVGGFIYTFSSYHFANAHGQMQLVTMQWVPLFLLLWWVFLRRPTYTRAGLAVLSLLFVLLTDYYYFLFAVFIAIAAFFYLMRKGETSLTEAKKIKKPVLVFIIAGLLFVAPLPLRLFLLSSSETMLGSHPVTIFSTDLFAPFINGGFWRFSFLTDWYWSTVRAWYIDSTVYLGLSTMFLLAIATIRRKRIHADIVFWLTVAFIGYIFSLGPRLVIAGRVFDNIPLPYSLLESLFPIARLSGTPVRIMFVVFLASAIVSAMVLARFKLYGKMRYVGLVILLLVLFVDVWPGSMPMQHKDEYPSYVMRLRELPGGDDTGVLDTAAKTSRKLAFYQTVHEKPVANNFLNQMPLARTPSSVLVKDMMLLNTALNGDIARLCNEYAIRYIVMRDKPQEIYLEDTLIYSDSDVKIYDLAMHQDCSRLAKEDP
jgi:hypothetical protein